METLATTLGRLTGPGELFTREPDGAIRCHACGHLCLLRSGKEGICRVRFNADGILRVPRGYVAGLAVDPIEKKPFFHAFPGAPTLSFGMLGCDYHCAYCQNWLTSQVLRDADALHMPTVMTAAEIAGLAVRHRTPVITSTYNEPLITSEWAVEIFRHARERNIACAYVSNGNATPEVLEYLRPWVRLFKIDLKGFRQATYRQLGGKLDTVLDTIRRVHAMGMWVEVVTLVVPGFNDSRDELSELAGFLASVSPDIPWHVTAFHGDYRMTEPENTDAAGLRRAAAIGREAGLRYVYAGNLPGRVEELEHTRCPSCTELLIERLGYRILRNTLEAGACPRCHLQIPGVWG